MSRPPHGPSTAELCPPHVRLAARALSVLLVGVFAGSCNQQRGPADPSPSPAQRPAFRQEIAEIRSELNGVVATETPQGPGPSREGQTTNLRNAANGTVFDEVTGAVGPMAPHPTDANILYVGTVNGGVWKTMNALSASPTWVPKTDQMESLSIGALAIDKQRPNVLAAGLARTSSFSGEGGSVGKILLSFDSGDTWTAITPSAGFRSLQNEQISGIALEETSAGGPTTIVVASNTDTNALWRSTDSGATWTLISGTGTAPNVLRTGHISQLVRDPNNDNRLYCDVIGEGVFASGDFGATWTSISDSDMGGPAMAMMTDNDKNLLTVGKNGHVYVAVIKGGTLEWIGRHPGLGNAGGWQQMDRMLNLLSGGPIDNITGSVLTSTIDHGFREGELRTMYVRITNSSDPTLNGDHLVTAVQAGKSLEIASGGGAVWRRRRHSGARSG